MIAERFGTEAIQNTYDRIMKEWSGNYIYLTELVMMLNWNIWYWDGMGPKYADDYARLYNELWEQADQYAMENLEGEELDYFLRTVD